MNTPLFQSPDYVEQLTQMANQELGGWVKIRHHSWRSLYAPSSTDLYNNFGDVIGKLEENTVYLWENAPCPLEDLLHELGHAIARRFNLIGHQDNGYNGRWEQRQMQLIARIQHGRYWSPLLHKLCQDNKRDGNQLTTVLGSEIWAEVFMFWFLYPDREERFLIEEEMESLKRSEELVSIYRMVSDLLKSKTTVTRQSQKTT